MASSGMVQIPELVSILLQCVKPLTWAMISTNLCALCMLCHNTAFKVVESNHKCNLPLALRHVYNQMPHLYLTF